MIMELQAIWSGAFEDRSIVGLMQVLYSDFIL